MCQDKSIEIFVDNKSTLILKKRNALFYTRNEHVNNKYPSIRESIRKKEV